MARITSYFAARSLCPICKMSTKGTERRWCRCCNQHWRSEVLSSSLQISFFRLYLKKGWKSFMCPILIAFEANNTSQSLYQICVLRNPGQTPPEKQKPAYGAWLLCKIYVYVRIFWAKTLCTRSWKDWTFIITSVAPRFKRSHCAECFMFSTASKTWMAFARTNRICFDFMYPLTTIRRQAAVTR